MSMKSHEINLNGGFYSHVGTPNGWMTMKNTIYKWSQVGFYLPRMESYGNKGDQSKVAPPNDGFLAPCRSLDVHAAGTAVAKNQGAKMIQI